MEDIEHLMRAAHTWYAVEKSELTTKDKLYLIDVLAGEYYAKWAYHSNIHPGDFDVVWSYGDAYRKLDYQKEYLKTIYWQYVRKLVIEERGNRCEECGAEPSIDVHHLTYEHIGEEHLFLNDFVVLCRRCHEKKHEVIDAKAD